MPNQVPAAVKYFAEKQQQGKFTFQAGRYVYFPTGSWSLRHFLPFTVVVRFLFMSALGLAGFSPRWTPRSQSLCRSFQREAEATIGEGSRGVQ